MNNKKYDELIKNTIEKEKPLKNISIAFFSGGVVGVLGQLLTNCFLKSFELEDAYLLTFMVLIIIGSLLTGFGFFDKVLSFCKCGLIVPSTGFANSMTSSAMDTKREGFVKGIGSSIFKLTGSIILYGVFFGIILGYIRSII